jgi:hypothetical protein
VAEDGELWAQKRCESKPPLKALQSHSYITKNPRVACGSPLGVKPHLDPDERSFNEK